MKNASIARVLFSLIAVVCGLSQAQLSAAAPTAPSNLKVTPLGANAFRLEWQDNSTDEVGWEIRTSLPPAVPSRFDRITTANVTSRIVTFAGFFPGVTIHFQIAAYNGASEAEVFSPSPIVTGKGLSPAVFYTPSSLRVVSFNDGEATLTWVDRSTVEYGYEVEVKAGNATSFTSLGTTGPGTAFTIPIGNLSPSTLYSFRIRGVTVGRTPSEAYQYTSYSNVAAITTKAFLAPTALVAKATSDSSVLLTWKDESAIETSYDVEFRVVGQNTNEGGSVEANSRSVNITDLAVGVLYEFRVRASKGDLKSAFTPYVRLRISDRFTSSLNPPIFFGVPFTYEILNTRPEKLTALTVTGLPAGLTYNPVTKLISGSATVEGAKVVKIIARYGTEPAVQSDLVLRIVRPPKAPLVVTTFPPQTLTVRRPVALSVLGRFSDPDTTSAQRVTTSLGSFDVILYPLATPLTVRNFLCYANGKRYTDSFFHRSLPNFVVQGGGYTQTTATGFRGLVKAAPVVNEPGISNLRGTVAMAKLPDLPNSGTSEFFVNVNDNSENLDSQNSGFTVFGRVPTTGMAIFDAINALPTRTYNVSLAGVPSSLADIPINSQTPSPAIDPTQLVRISAIVPSTILTYQVSSQNSAIATAVLSGTNFTLLGIAKGTTTVTVTAIDLDAQTTSQVIPVTVN